jgi:sulfatase maturation enzyme AslB (radical SAM superfamily)
MRCSLRCRDCSNLMQYFIKPEHTDFSQSEKAIRKFFSLIDFTFDVRVLGGEPFMNPELYKFIDLLSGYSSQYACMWIQTNGTIIPTKKNIETLQKNNDKIFIRISDYQNQHQRIEYLVKLLTEKHIFHEVVYIPAWHDCAHIQDYHRRQEENEKVLKDCAVRDTPTIIDGKIFRCPMSGNAWLLSILPPNVYEYVDILSTTDTDNTLKLKIQTLMQQKYIKACNFCGNRSVNNQIKPAIQTDEPIKYKSYKKLGGVTT